MGLKDIRYRLEDLELGKKIEGHRPFVAAGLLLVIVLCLSMVFCHLNGGGGKAPREVELLYFDLSSKTIRLVEHHYPAMPTSPLPGTTDVFLARVYACEDSPEVVIKEGMTIEDLETNGLFIAYLEREDPEPKEESDGLIYRAMDNDQWYEPTDKGFEQLIAAIYERCPKAKRFNP